MVSCASYGVIGIQPVGSPPAAKNLLPVRPYFPALSRQQVPEQNVNSDIYTANHIHVMESVWQIICMK